MLHAALSHGHGRYQFAARVVDGSAELDDLGAMVMVSAMADFQQLVDRQYAPLYRFALSLAKTEADAADLT